MIDWEGSRALLLSGRGRQVFPSRYAIKIHLIRIEYRDRTQARWDLSRLELKLPASHGAVVLEDVRSDAKVKRDLQQRIAPQMQGS